MQWLSVEVLMGLTSIDPFGCKGTVEPKPVTLSREY